MIFYCNQKHVPEMNDVVRLPIAFTSLATHPWYANANNTSKWPLKERKIQQRQKKFSDFSPSKSTMSYSKCTPSFQYYASEPAMNLLLIFFNPEVCKITLCSVHRERYLFFFLS